MDIKFEINLAQPKKHWNSGSFAATMFLIFVSYGIPFLSLYTEGDIPNFFLKLLLK